MHVELLAALTALALVKYGHFCLTREARKNKSFIQRRRTALPQKLIGIMIFVFGLFMLIIAVHM